MDLTAERIAENDSTFRDANERISEHADEYGLTERVPFICECAETTCRDIVRITLAEYEEVRSHPTRFLTAPGHEGAELEAGRVVAVREDYVVVEKLGAAGEVARELDPRGGTEEGDG